MPTHAGKPLVSLVVPFHCEDETIDAFMAGDPLKRTPAAAGHGARKISVK
ncbi:hypothetical protein [Burkholderia stabilis]|uniref:Uncharacterized protein n=1 Tax=Burkholderia stabilis TaxID=95485 RepID=A0A1Y1BR35_9BURK|nr:hypothetical protein [Burkholderia stabilis]BAX62235.1 hypothetical protein BSFP_051020 [Burkholderia stabilis]